MYCGISMQKGAMKFLSLKQISSDLILRFFLKRSDKIPSNQRFEGSNDITYINLILQVSYAPFGQVFSIAGAFCSRLCDYFIVNVMRLHIRLNRNPFVSSLDLQTLCLVYVIVSIRIQERFHHLNDIAAPPCNEWWRYDVSQRISSSSLSSS